MSENEGDIGEGNVHRCMVSLGSGHTKTPILSKNGIQANGIRSVHCY